MNDAERAQLVDLLCLAHATSIAVTAALAANPDALNRCKEVASSWVFDGNTGDAFMARSRVQAHLDQICEMATEFSRPRRPPA